MFERERNVNNDNLLFMKISTFYKYLKIKYEKLHVMDRIAVSVSMSWISKYRIVSPIYLAVSISISVSGHHSAPDLKLLSSKQDGCWGSRDP